MSLPKPLPRTSKTAPKVSLSACSPAEVSEWGTEEHILCALEIATDIIAGTELFSAEGNAIVRGHARKTRERLEDLRSHLRSAL